MCVFLCGGAFIVMLILIQNDSQLSYSGTHPPYASQRPSDTSIVIV